MLTAVLQRLMVTLLMAKLRKTGVRAETGSCGRARIVVRHFDGRVRRIFDDPIIEADILQQPAAAARALDADAAVGSLRHDIARHHVADAAGGLAAQHHRAMPVMDGAIGDGDVFRDAVDAQTVRVFAGFDADGVVAGVEIGIRDAHVARRIDIHAVGVGAREALDDHIADYDVVAIENVQHPHGRAQNMDAFDQDVLALHRAG